jgi:hypothetical protein
LFVGLLNVLTIVRVFVSCHFEIHSGITETAFATVIPFIGWNTRHNCESLDYDRKYGL